MKLDLSKVFSVIGFAAIVVTPLLTALMGRPPVEVGALSVVVSVAMFLLGKYSADEEEER